jgi:O-antigen/teichoic acid export membrane protein
MIKKLKTLTNTEDKKQLLGNFVSLSVLRGFDFLIPLITLPYLVRVIGMEYFGLINFALSLALYFGAIIQYGFGVTATREIARNRGNPEALAKTYSATLSTTLLLSLVSAIAFTFLVLTIDKFNEYLVIYFFAIAFTVMKSLFPIWFFQGMERMKFIVYLTLIARFLFLICLFIFVTQEDDFYLVLLLNALTAFISFVAALWLIKYRFKVGFLPPKISDIKRLLSEGRHAFITQLAPNLYNNSSAFLLGLFTNNTVVGYYTAAIKVIEALMSMGVILTNTFLPYLSRNIKNHSVFFKVMSVSGGFFTIFSIVFSDQITVILFGSDNLVISNYISLLSLWIFFIFFRDAIGVNYLMLMGYERVYRNIILYISLISFFFALILVPMFEIYGAISIILGSSFLMAMFTYSYYRKIKKG